jgi:ATP-dependent DNA helicase RecG
MLDRTGNVHIPLQYIKGVGPKRAAALGEIEIHEVTDLFHYYPRGYLDRSQIVRISDLRAHLAKREPVTIIAEVIRQEARRVRKSNRLLFLLNVKDESGFLTCVWFEGYQWYKDAFEIGELLALSAVPTLDKTGRPQFVHPQFDRLKSVEEDEPDWGKLFNTGGIIPKYRSGADLEKAGLDSRGFRRIIRNALKSYINSITETLPEGILKKYSLIPLKDAVRAVHFPESFQELEQARARLKFEELFFLQLILAIRKNISKLEVRGFHYAAAGKLSNQLIESLPFKLTDAQKRVWKEIENDFHSAYPMNRLLQGDVGSGKTIIALLAALRAMENGLQAAFMAPTEILAGQHYQTITQFLQEMPVNVRLLIGGQRKKLREDIMEDIRAGNAQLVVGTHALVEGKVEFARLGLVIVDEQHRFGVLQRAELREKGINPDVLVMTATPIPRTLAMTLYGDLDVSVIDQLPSSRIPIRTGLRTEKEKPKIFDFIRQEIRKGRQAYIVFPLIEESEKIDLKAAIQEYEYLQKEVFQEFRLGLLHGRMKTEEKDAVMQKFTKNEYQILVTTTVIEVGIDIPNATIMLVENAERFGLSQLHQLRGRVGRGAEQSYCILIANYGWYEKPQRGRTGEDVVEQKALAARRLETMASTTDGFKIAEVDLQLRGPGEFFGTRQSGIPELKIADLAADTEIVVAARKEAFAMIHDDPQLRHPDHACVRNQFEIKFKSVLELGKIG